jgi:hypothetical protein
MTANADLFLHIGDKLMLQDDEANGLVGCCGFASGQLGVQPRDDAESAIVSDSVFTLRQQQNYSVTRQMRAFLDREGMSEQEARTDGRYIRLLQERKREKEANLVEFQHSIGREVRYGNIVQLQHAASQKYVSVTRHSAQLDRDGRRVLLDRDAGELAWFKVMASLRVHSEGMPVHFGDPMTLEHVQTGLKLHVDTRPRVRLDDGRHEVAGTQRASPLRILLYRSYADDALKSELLVAGDFIAQHSTA